MQLVNAETGEIFKKEALLIRIGKFLFTPKGLIVKGEPTFEEGMKCGYSLRDFKQGLHFAIGDWLIFMEDHWPDLYPQAMSIFGYDYSTLATDKWIAKKIPISRRREVPFGYHRAVGGLEPAQQDEILDKAEREKWDRQTIRAKVREIRNPTPQNRSRRIKEVQVSCDLLYGEWDGKAAIEFGHTDGQSRTYCPGWKSLYRLVRVIRSMEWCSQPLDTYGVIGWIAKRR